MIKEEYKHSALTEKIIGSAMKVHSLPAQCSWLKYGEQITKPDSSG